MYETDVFRLPDFATGLFSLPPLTFSPGRAHGMSKYDQPRIDVVGKRFLETATSSPATVKHELGVPFPALLLMHAAFAMPTSRCANDRGRLHQAVRCTECRRLWPYCTICGALLYGDTCTCGGFETPTCETDDEAETVFGVSDSEEEREVGSSQEHALLPTSPPPPPESPPPETPASPPPECLRRQVEPAHPFRSTGCFSRQRLSYQI